MKQRIFFAVFLFCSLIFGQQTTYATQGGSSDYFPGAFATFGAGLPPETGFQFVNQTFFFKGDGDKAVLGGRIGLGINADAVYNYAGGFYTYKAPVLGARLQIGALVPLASMYTKAGVNTRFGSLENSGNSAGFGDSMASAALYWKGGDLHYKLVQTVFAPTGAYNASSMANVGMNHWAFDTSLAITWMNKKGTEITIMPGIMFNTMNNAAEYHSGNEFHIDFMVNQFLKKNFAVGLQGYYYSQLTGDSGSGALLGNFQGQALGFGPAILLLPEFGKGRLSVIAKWITDVHNVNRMHGNYGQLTIAYKF